MLTKLRNSSKVIGLKQSKRAIIDGLATACFIARDAEQRITEPMEALCREQGVEIVYVDTMRMLGEACGIEVGAAVAVLTR